MYLKYQIFVQVSCYPAIISDKYLIRIRVSEPISIALKMRERKSVEKNNLAHT